MNALMDSARVDAVRAMRDPTKQATQAAMLIADAFQVVRGMSEQHREFSKQLTDMGDELERVFMDLWGLAGYWQVSDASTGCD